MTGYRLVTESPMRDPRESRVLRCEVALRRRDGVAVAAALSSGALRVLPGVRAWVEAVAPGLGLERVR